MKKIYLSKGSGEGCTEIAAYCRALENAGIMNLNIIRLTSILPHNSEIIYGRPEVSHEDYGKKLYAVLSETRTEEKGKSICAGLGWILEKNGTGHGLINEVQGEDESSVKAGIEESLREVTRDRPYEEIEIVTESIVCKDKPVCALVVLSFELEDWMP